MVAEMERLQQLEVVDIPRSAQGSRARVWVSFSGSHLKWPAVEASASVAAEQVEQVERAVLRLEVKVPPAIVDLMAIQTRSSPATRRGCLSRLQEVEPLAGVASSQAASRPTHGNQFPRNGATADC